MKIFITGITGFVGGSVANYFASLGHEVVGIGRSDRLPPHVSGNCRYVKADMLEPLADIHADIVVHAAGLASHTASFEELYDTNVRGTINVLDAAKNVSHIILISSSSVYHFKDHAMKETEAVLTFQKLSDYGKTKLLAEQCIFRNKMENRITILRPRAIYGRYDHSLLPKLTRLIKGNKLFLPAHLSKKISLTHIDNLIQAIELCILRQTVQYDVFNVADKEVYDLHEILTKLLPLAAGRQLHTVTIPAWLFELVIIINSMLKSNTSLNRFAAGSLTDTAILSTTKITQQIDYNPKKNFFDSQTELKNWIQYEGGWKKLFKTNPFNTVQ